MIGFEIAGVPVTNGLVIGLVAVYLAVDLVVVLVQWRRRIVDERRRYVVPEPRHQHTHARVVGRRR